MALTVEQQASRDHWRAVHMAGDRSKPIWLPDLRPRRVYAFETPVRRCSGKVPEVME